MNSANPIANPFAGPDRREGCLMATMSVVKALKPKRSWGQVAYTDRYLRGCLPEQIREGIRKTDPLLYGGLNCERDTFTKTLRMNMKWHGEKKVKAYEYVQSFSPDDCHGRLSPELVHQLGLEFAGRFFSEVPCLVVTHTDRNHLHNQFLIGNVNITTGKCLQLNARSLKEMKLFSGEQCRQHGLSASVFEDGKKKAAHKRSDAEHLMKSQGKVPVKDQLYEQIRTAITSPEVNSFDDFLQLISDSYGITCRVSGNTISFKHPNLSRPVRGTRLAADLTREGIEMGISLAVRERMETTEAPDTTLLGKPASSTVVSRSEPAIHTAVSQPEPEPDRARLYRYAHHIPAGRSDAADPGIVRTSSDRIVDTKPTASSSAVLSPAASTPAALSPAEFEACKAEMNRLVSERRRIRDLLLRLVEKLKKLQKDILNLRHNISVWKRDKAKLEQQLHSELTGTQSIPFQNRNRIR